MDWRRKLVGFYAVLDRDDPSLARSLLATARVLQIRFKGASREDVVAAARWVRALCDERGALLVVNDDIESALAARADGVHLGQGDLPLAEARHRIAEHVARGGAGLLIGISTHDLDQVAAAVSGGADYLGFGPVFPTATKINPDPVRGVAGLAAAVRAAHPVPVVAIGGITPERAGSIAATGAAAACAIAAVNVAPDPVAAGRAIATAFLVP